MRSLLLVSFTLCAAGCMTIEPCVAVPTTVQLEATPPAGGAPLVVTLRAETQAGYIGCGQGDLAVTRFSWDVDGDGLLDYTGADMDVITVRLDSPGAHFVRVFVFDSADEIAHAEIAIDVE